MSLYSQLAENLQFVSPSIYKSRFFKKLIGLSKENVLEREVEPELIWLKEFLPQKAVFIDVGANVGSFLYYLEYHLFPENIYAFEPNKGLYRRLKRLFPKINFYNIALSNENTTATFKIPMMNGETIHSRGTLQTDLKEEGEQKTILQIVKVMSLDEWAFLNNIPQIDFIKIDVEGNEHLTLKGAEQTIKKYRPTLMVEIEQRHHAEPIWNIIAEVETWGYEAHYLNRDSFKPERLTKDFINAQNAEFVKDYKNYINNIIFFSTEKF